MARDEKNSGIRELFAGRRINEVKDRHIDELLGITRGVLADGLVNESEAKFLLEWIENHFVSTELNEYPLNIIFDRLKNALSDNKLDENEAAELKELLTSFTGDKSISEQVDSMSSVLPLCDPAPEIFFENKTFCLTGAFTIGTRSLVEKLIKDCGANTVKQPSGLTDYLVIGFLGNAEWIHSSYGRKIENAVRFRDEKNSGISIVTEEHFLKYLD